MNDLAKHRGRGPRRWVASATPAVVLALVLCGCSARYHRMNEERKAYKIIQDKQQAGLNRTEPFAVEPPAETLRRRLLIDQHLPVAGPGSFGSKYLNRVAHWPERHESLVTPVAPEGPPAGAIVLSLNEALQAAALNSRDYQDQKEEVFIAALDLDLERDQFRTSFGGLLSGLFRRNETPGGFVDESIEASAVGAATQRLKSGSRFAMRFGWNLVKLLQPQQFTSQSVFGDATVQIPLLRGAGKHIAAEPLTQADRNALYAIYAFERFKHIFAVRVAREYLSALQRVDQVRNAEENYRGLITSTRRARRLLDAGILPPIQVDQSRQDELKARNRWIVALEAQTAALDSFKALLGLPVDAAIELDRAEFERLSEGARRLVAAAPDTEGEGPIPPADAPVELKPPAREHAGPYELESDAAIRIALTNRLDLRIAEARTFDAQRGVVVAANQLLPELTFLGQATITGDSDNQFKPERADYRAFLALDIGLERTAEAINYRKSLVSLEKATRTFQQVEDEVKFGVRERLRDLREARESLRIQSHSVELARRRVRGADLNLQAGRAQVRDLLEAQDDLLSAQNAFTAAAVDYRLAELELQRDMDVLQVGADGLWKEIEPAVLRGGEIR